MPGSKAFTIAEIIALHCKTELPGGMTDGYCSECGWLWPCRTVHIAQGWESADDCMDAKWCKHAKVRME